MENEPRKASDLLLSLESQVQTLLGIIRAQDLNIKILSNKLNNLLDLLEKNTNTSHSKIVVEAVNTAPITENNNIPIISENNIKIEDIPVGFRRTSRAETYAGDDTYLNTVQTTNTLPVQVPQQVQAEVTVSKNPTSNSTDFIKNNEKKSSKIEKKSEGSVIPIMQRIVNASGKSIFLADVEIIDLSSMESVFKTRTNGTGKWMASLPLGNYRVNIKKGESLTKDKLEATQDIQVDGSKSPLDLPVLIIKK